VCDYVKSGVVLTVVDVDNGIQISGGDHVDDVRHPLQPCRINSPVRRASIEVVGPCHWIDGVNILFSYEHAWLY
jgi:hypothetical protein